MGFKFFGSRPIFSPLGTSRGLGVKFQVNSFSGLLLISYIVEIGRPKLLKTKVKQRDFSFLAQDKYFN